MVSYLETHRVEIGLSNKIRGIWKIPISFFILYISTISIWNRFLSINFPRVIFFGSIFVCLIWSFIKKINIIDKRYLLFVAIYFLACLINLAAFGFVSLNSLFTYLVLPFLPICFLPLVDDSKKCNYNYYNRCYNPF